MFTLIVPDDTRKHVVAILKKIITAANRDIGVEVIYTDDVKKDEKSCLSLFERKKQKVMKLTSTAIVKFVDNRFLQCARTSFMLKSALHQLYPLSILVTKLQKRYD